MKLNIRQFSDDDDIWSDDFKLHFIINNLDTNKATYHTASTKNHFSGVLYKDITGGCFVEYFKFEGEIE